MIRIERLTRRSELDEIQPLREHLSARPDPVREAAIDAQSIVLAYREGKELVGTTRFIPFGLGLAPVEEHVVRLGIPHTNRCVEGGRLVLAEKWRGKGMLVRCFVPTFFVLRRLGYEDGFTICNRKLSMVYRKIGCLTAAENVVESGQGTLSILHFKVEYSSFLIAAKALVLG